jgi:hypothetical protein
MYIVDGICSRDLLWGRPHAGGWHVCGDESFQSAGQQCVVYSFGLGADWSFDNHGESEGCEVHAYLTYFMNNTCSLFFLFLMSESFYQVHGFDPTGLLWRQGMHGTAYANIDYAKQYPSKSKYFHNWGIGAADAAIYPPNSIPQVV